MNKVHIDDYYDYYNQNEQKYDDNSFIAKESYPKVLKKRKVINFCFKFIFFQKRKRSRDSKYTLESYDKVKKKSKRKN